MVAIRSAGPSAALIPASAGAGHADQAQASREQAAHDATLVRRFNAGDEPAFVEIVARYRQKMYAVAHTRLRNHADAEEIAQDVFIRAHRALAQFRGDCSLSTWLHRITVNLAHNRYWYFFRRRRHLTRSLDEPAGDDTTASFAEMVTCDAAGPRREAMTREFSALVTTCMERLRPPQREILNQRNVLNCTYDEIAAALGITLGTVKSRIARARESLRGLLVEACPEFMAESLSPDWFDPVRPQGRWHAASA